MKSWLITFIGILSLLNGHHTINATSDESTIGIHKKMILGVPSLAGLISLIIYLKKNEAIYGTISSYAQIYVQIEGAKAVMRNGLSSLKQGGSSFIGLFYTWPDRKKQKKEQQLKEALEHSALQERLTAMVMHLDFAKNKIDRLKEKNKLLNQHVENFIIIELKYQLCQKELNEYANENKKLKEKLENLRTFEDELIKYKTLWTEVVGSMEKRDEWLAQATINNFYKQEVAELKEKIKELENRIEKRVDQFIEYGQQYSYNSEQRVDRLIESLQKPTARVLLPYKNSSPFKGSSFLDET